MFKKYWILVALVVSVSGAAAQNTQGDIPKPTAAQLAWQKAEIGVLISYDLPVFQGTPYNQAQNRITPFTNANIFNPTKLNTDQWIKPPKRVEQNLLCLRLHTRQDLLYIKVM